VNAASFETESDKPMNVEPQKDAYARILEAIDDGDFPPGSPLVESDLAERFGMSRTPIREALQRLETQTILRREGRSLIVSSLDHDQMGELYVVRGELEGLAARLAAQHAAPEEVAVLQDMAAKDRLIIGKPREHARANRRFHHQIHLASHNRYLIRQLDSVHRAMALLVRTTLGESGRGEEAQDEHDAIVRAIAARDGEAACAALRDHISRAYETRLKIDLGAAE